MAGVTEAQASVMHRRRSCNIDGGVAYTCPLMYCLTFEILCEGPPHVGTIHFGVGATVDSQQSRLLHPAETPSTVVLLSSLVKYWSNEPVIKIPHQTLIDQRS
ncbi:hypothetical protein AVEN_85865-1 [Araneus ventricosus]|uniref:Uncharacterized protein n=1 Tax=Araneus ventricosus TaxID=182803 RepID=A0A4Y2KQP8_ARAVE|nr:hypothetical protein AVEN_85865-1 [Araneus ventricosus]